MNIEFITGNPIVVATDGEDVRADVSASLEAIGGCDVIRCTPEHLEIENGHVRKKVKYPTGADVRWLVEQVRRFKEQSARHYKAADATEKRFVELCKDVLSNGGTITFRGDRDERYPQRIVEVVHLSRKTKGEHTFEAKCETSILGAYCVEHIKRLIAEENARREEEKREKAERAEYERLRELTRKHNIRP